MYRLLASEAKNMQRKAIRTNDNYTMVMLTKIKPQTQRKKPL